MNLERTPQELLEEKLQAMVADMVMDAQAGKSAGVKMSATEHKFYANVNTEVGTKDPQLLPEDTINEVFDALSQDHPFLATLNMQNTGMRLKVIKAETSGQAVWGDLYGDIKGQLDVEFVNEDAMHNKLTSFVAIPKDAKDFGPEWLKKFIVDQIVEAMATALEEAFISGDGSNLPIGLDRDLNKGKIVDKKTVYEKKAVSGTLDFADTENVIKQVAQIAQELSIAENGKMLKTDGFVYFAVSPAEYILLRGKFTVQNASGVYVENYPMGMKLLPAQGVKQGEAIAYLPSRYDAAIGGGLTVSSFDQTLAMEDMDLHIAKQYAYGKAVDNNAARVYAIKVPTGLETDETPSEKKVAKTTSK